MPAVAIENFKTEKDQRPVAPYLNHIIGVLGLHLGSAERKYWPLFPMTILLLNSFPFTL